MKKKKEVKYYGAGTFIITLLIIVCFASLLLPLVTGDYGISVLDTVRGKTVGGVSILPRLGIFGIACVITIILPLAVMFIASLVPFDRIKKQLSAP